MKATLEAIERRFYDNPTDANLAALHKAERQWDRERGVDPDALAQTRYEAQQRANCWSDTSIDALTHNPL